jgi:hypothetical protein
MAAIQCKVDIPAVTGLQDSQLTVGREFFLNCSGDWPRTFKPDYARLEPVAEGAKYELKLLGFEFRTPTEADLKVTSYLAGPHRFPNLVVTDGALRVELGNVQFQVQSVLPTDGEKVEPYGPIGPAQIPIPLLYWLFLLGVLLFVAGFVGLRIWRYQQRKAMLERLKKHDLALSPIQQFHQSMRRLQRENPAFYGKEATPEELRAGVDELVRMFKVYLSRRLRVPAFEWNERLVLNDIRRYHRALFEESSKKIRDLFEEFKKAGVASQSLKSRDVIQLSETLRKTLEGLERFLDSEEQNVRGGRH